MKYVALLWWIVLGWQEVPFKPDDEFDIRMEMSFRQRPQSSNTLHYAETRDEYERRTSSDQLPFVVLNVTLKAFHQGEVRMKVIRDSQEQIMSRKVAAGNTFKLEIGFTDDAKDGVKGYHHRVVFLDEKKREVNQILIVIDKEGNYLVNNQKRGKL